ELWYFRYISWPVALFFFFSSRRRHTRFSRDWSSDVCSSDLIVAATALLVGFAISLLTPLIWTSWRTRRPPWPLETYINGVHNLGEPQPWLFPIFHGQGLPSSGWRWDSCC